MNDLPRQTNEKFVMRLVGMGCLTLVALALIYVHQYDYLSGVALLAFFLW